MSCRFEHVAHRAPVGVGDRVPVVLELERDLVPYEGRAFRHDDFVTLYLVRRGRGVHEINGQAHGVVRGDVCLMPAGAVHRYERVVELELESIYVQQGAFDPNWLTAMTDEGLIGADVWSTEGNGPGGVLAAHLRPSVLEGALRDLLALRVSRDCGFADPAYFTRSFRAAIGQSPREYRTNQTKALTS